MPMIIGNPKEMISMNIVKAKEEEIIAEDDLIVMKFNMLSIDDISIQFK